MRYNIQKILTVILTVSCAVMAVSCLTDKADVPVVPDAPPLKPQQKHIFVMSDIHVMAPELMANFGTPFEDYISTDPKLLEYSGEVLNVIIDVILQDRPDLVLIPGDLTKDGEFVSHQQVVSILHRLTDAGIRTLVVPGNHDIDNPYGVCYLGDKTMPAERTSPEQFEQLYCDFGYDTRSERDPVSLSYACEPIDGLVMLCIDSNRYGDNLYKDRGDSIDYNQTAGRIREATLQWMCQQADAARSQGKQVAVMMHHNIVEHYDGQEFFHAPYIISDWQSVADTMMAHDIHLAFTGHQHLQDIAQYRRWRVGNNGDAVIDSLVDVATGSTITYPNPWRRISLNEDFTEWAVETGYVKAIPSVSDVQTMCKERLATHIQGGLAWIINDYWSVAEEYRSKLALMGMPKFLPTTPSATCDLLMKYMGDTLIESYLTYNEGNEWQSGGLLKI